MTKAMARPKSSAWTGFLLIGRLLACVMAVVLLSAPLKAQQLDPSEEKDDLWDYFGARPFRITASTGLDFTRGDYGTGNSSDLLYIPSALKLELDPFVFKLTVPWVQANGDVVVFGDQVVGVPLQPGQRSGIGDVTMSVGYVYFPSVSYLPLTEVKGKIKFGTADETQGLGTGETDFTLQLDLSKRFGSITPFGGGGYKFIGEPAGFSLRNKWFAYGGLTLRVNRSVTLGVAYDWSQSVVSRLPDDHELSPFMTLKFGRHFAIDPYAVIGLSQNAPDWGLGMQIRVIFDRY